MVSGRRSWAAPPPHGLAEHAIFGSMRCLWRCWETADIAACSRQQRRPLEAELSPTIAKTPLQRLSTSAETVDAALLLTSGRAAFITGTSLDVDRGLTIARE